MKHIKDKLEHIMDGSGSEEVTEAAKRYPHTHFENQADAGAKTVTLCHVCLAKSDLGLPKICFLRQSLANANMSQALSG